MDDERQEELDTLSAIYPEVILDTGKKSHFSAILELPIVPTTPLLVRFIPTVPENSHLVRYLPIAGTTSTYTNAASNATAHVERDVELSHLPPLTLHMSLPDGYPATVAPKVELTTHLDWLPQEKITELEEEVARLWEDYGRCQILYTYIDLLQQATERAFDLRQSAQGCLTLPATRERELVAFDTKTRQEKFDAGTYGCGVCLEPKKGSACYQMRICSHVFCRQCLQDFYNNAITEGDVAGVRCLDPSCGEERGPDDKKRRKKETTIHPRELLAMGIEESMVRRYVEMKRKKKQEADKSTVYCPRTWCQAPAKSKKYPSIPADLTSYIDNEISDDEHRNADGTAQTALRNENNIPPDPNERLAVCEKCEFAFCKVCYMGWHGAFARCFPRDPNELGEEEKASYEYIRIHTSPCPYCNAPVQKTMGCNHMNCFQCRTHFCYLCGSWLDGLNPYQHFNKPGMPCYQRLWELEEGDEGQAPGDGHGFAGGARGWEQAAAEVAREADEEEAAAVPAQAPAEEGAVAAQGNPAALPLLAAMADLDIEDPDPLDDNEDDAAPRPVQRGAQRRRNPIPAHPPGVGGAPAVRNHERAQGRGVRVPRQRGPAPHMDDVQNGLNEHEQAEIQQFLRLAQRDEEDGWDSDELDDERFIIPHR